MKHVNHAPDGLLMNLSKTPLAIEDAAPKLCWVVHDPEPNQIQTAYQILVATDLSLLTEEGADVWNSGKVLSRQSSHVPYGGASLAADSIYYWTVRTWNRQDRAGEFAKPQFFSTAVKEHWKAGAIWGEIEPEQGKKGNILFLRSEFTAESKPIKKALVSAIGQNRQNIYQYNFKLYLNGENVGLGSPRALYDGIYNYVYSTFDVTESIQKGDNAIGAICYATEDKRFALRLKVFYEDGTEQIVNSDAFWRALDGTEIYGDDGTTSTRYNELHVMADNIDARLFPYGWDTPGFDDSAWEHAVAREPLTDLIASPIENMYQYTVPAVEVVDLKNNDYLVKLDKEIIGGLRLKLDVPAERCGTHMTILSGEELNEDGTVRWFMRTRNTYREYWTVKGGEQVIENFGMKGFRYVEIHNCPVVLTADMVEGVAYRQDFDDSEADFSSSEPILNDIFALVQYSMKATNQDIYTDSQTRERSDNNSGDVYVNVKTSHAVSRNYTLAWFTTHHMNTLRYCISEYSIHAILTAWELYQYTGDPSMLAQDYDHFIRLLCFDHLDEERGLWWFQTRTDMLLQDLIDWPPAERDGYQHTLCYYNTVVNSYQYQGLLTVASIAEVLGKTEDAEKYRALAERLKKTINDTFYNAGGDGLYAEGMQKDGTLVIGKAAPATLYPLLHGLAEDDGRALDYVAGRGITGSVFGTQFLLELLYKSGRGQRALELLTDRGIRSYCHMMYDLGATITTEAWDPTLKKNMTFSHPWGSAAGNALFEGMAGIRPTTPGFETVTVKPQIGTLAFAEWKMPTIKGELRVELRADDPAYAAKLTVAIPANTTATVYVPLGGANTDRTTVDGNEVKTETVDGYLVYENIGSGEHMFLVKR